MSAEAIADEHVGHAIRTPPCQGIEYVLDPVEMDLRIGVKSFPGPRNTLSHGTPEHTPSL